MTFKLYITKIQTDNQLSSVHNSSINTVLEQYLLSRITSGYPLACWMFILQLESRSNVFITDPFLPIMRPTLACWIVMLARHGVYTVTHCNASFVPLLLISKDSTAASGDSKYRVALYRVLTKQADSTMRQAHNFSCTLIKTRFCIMKILASSQ